MLKNWLVVSCCSVTRVTSYYTFFGSLQNSTSITVHGATECFLANRIHFENRYYASHSLKFWKQKTKKFTKSSYLGKGTPTVPCLILLHQKQFVNNAEIRFFCVWCYNKTRPLVLKKVKFQSGPHESGIQGKNVCGRINSLHVNCNLLVFVWNSPHSPLLGIHSWHKRMRISRTKYTHDVAPTCLGIIYVILRELCSKL